VRQFWPRLRVDPPPRKYSALLKWPVLIASIVGFLIGAWVGRMAFGIFASVAEFERERSSALGLAPSDTWSTLDYRRAFGVLKARRSKVFRSEGHGK
jgi:hypothetical protein